MDTQDTKGRAGKEWGGKVKMTQRVPETIERFFWELPLSRTTITPSPDLPPINLLSHFKSQKGQQCLSLEFPCCLHPGPSSLQISPFHLRWIAYKDQEPAIGCLCSDLWGWQVCRAFGGSSEWHMKGAEKGETLVLFSVVELLEVQASVKVWHVVDAQDIYWPNDGLMATCQILLTAWHLISH